VRSSSCMGLIVGKSFPKRKPQEREHLPEAGWNDFWMAKPPTIAPRVRLAQNLRALIDMQQLSAPKVAGLAKVDPKTMNNLLHGRFDPRLSLVEKVANVFGLSAWQLLAADLRTKHFDSVQVVRLLDHYSNAKDSGRDAIMQVAQIASNSDS
jgi:transcriptional regulator with XRE-family HTH domain